jgi:hypothetical protein
MPVSALIVLLIAGYIALGFSILLIARERRRAAIRRLWEAQRWR